MKSIALGCIIPSKPNLIADLRYGSGCDYHRVVLPHKYLTASPKVPVYWFNRGSTGGIQSVKRLRDRGVKIWLDLDDHWEVPEDHFMAGVFRDNGSGARALAHIQLSDVVTVTNSELASQVSKINRNVVIVPNALPFDEDQFTKSTDTKSSSPLVYVAGASHRHDLRSVVDAFSAGSLTVCGETSNPEWQKMRHLGRRHNFVGAKSIDNYMSLYDGHRAAIAPLSRDDVFNRCKSNLKVLEAGAKGIPIIASRYHPYLNELDRKHVLYASSLTEWRQVARKICGDRKFAEAAGAALAEHVRKHYHLRQANEIRRQIIESFS